MKWVTGSTNIRHTFIVFTFLLFFIGILTILYCLDFLADPKWSAIISGLLTGFIVALFQTWLNISEIQELDKYRKLGIRKILESRNNRAYYADLISRSKKRIYIYGVTAQRLLHHFANKDDKENGSTALLNVLTNGVDVKVLIAAKNQLSGDNLQKYNMAEQKLAEIAKNNTNFKYAYYDHEPTHSIFAVDDECIVGPIFPDITSEHTPAIHMNSDGKLRDNYLTYFEKEWEKFSK